MRLFWTIIALLALSTAAWFFLRAPETATPPAVVTEPTAPLSTTPTPAPSPSAVVTTPSPPAPPPAAHTPPPTPPAHEPAPAPAASNPPVVAEPPAPTPTNPPAPAAPPAAAKTEAPKPQPAKPSTETLTDISSEMDKLLGVTPTPAPETSKPTATEPSAAAPTKPDTTKPDTAKPAAPLNVKLTKQDDGSTLVDDKYIIKGTGTKEDPYRVTWEMLVSAQDTYQPRLGRKVIPDRLKMIDGKWVRISGYIAFPVMAASPDEMLMMLNQWDGCCIGVPPTPYDAIEVKLKAPAKGNDRLRTSGTLTAQFKVDPYLVKDWLVSLFVMESGELSDTAGEAAQGQHTK